MDPDPTRPPEREERNERTASAGDGFAYTVPLGGAPSRSGRSSDRETVFTPRVPAEERPGGFAAGATEVVEPADVVEVPGDGAEAPLSRSERRRIERRRSRNRKIAAGAVAGVLAVGAFAAVGAGLSKARQEVGVDVPPAPTGLPGAETTGGGSGTPSGSGRGEGPNASADAESGVTGRAEPGDAPATSGTGRPGSSGGGEGDRERDGREDGREDRRPERPTREPEPPSTPPGQESPDPRPTDPGPTGGPEEPDPGPEPSESPEPGGPYMTDFH
ncbi:hypothetical protein [Nocardiopsis baichengensis]|uniref:hypothetical protein n=1 Tax=Nocardiopsis baichengensis TaxID=280240 RepID=UPI00036AE236|nr:hypothetical protein [Nocardiopsis baichengensis]